MESCSRRLCIHMHPTHYIRCVPLQARAASKFEVATTPATPDLLPTREAAIWELLHGPCPCAFVPGVARRGGTGRQAARQRSRCDLGCHVGASAHALLMVACRAQSELGASSVRARGELSPSSGRAPARTAGRRLARGSSLSRLAHLDLAARFVTLTACASRSRGAWRRAAP